MRNTTVYIDENLVRLAKARGMNISQEFQNFLMKRLEVIADANQMESLKIDLMNAEAKTEAIRNHINKMKKEKEKSEKLKAEKLKAEKLKAEKQEPEAEVEL